MNIPDSVKTLGNYAFDNCKSLAAVTMTGDMDAIGSYAFQNCGNLENVTMPDTLKTLDRNAFNNDDKLLEVTLPAGLNTIPDYAFYNCEALTHVKVGDGTVLIGPCAFDSCRNLVSVELPESLVCIGIGAFRYTGLTDIAIPDGVTAINSSAFSDCGQLSSVILPDSVVSLGASAFGFCVNLTDVKLSAGLVSLPESVFQCCPKLRSVSLPEGLRAIGAYAFQEDRALNAVLIQRSVTSIDDTAFQYIEPSQLTVYCYHDTAADTFAQAKGHPIVYLDGDDQLEGLTIEPVNADFEINLGIGHSLDKLGGLFTVKPENAPYIAQIVFSYEDADIAAVDNDTLTGLAVGDTRLVAAFDQNPDINASVIVHVRENITDFTLPAAFGTGTLTAVSWNGIERSTVIHIYDDPSAVTFVNVPAGLDVGDSFTLEPQVKAGAVFTGNEALHFIRYASGDESVARVTAGGSVTGVDYGSTTITAVTENGVTGTANVHVSAPVTDFMLPGRISVPIGATIEMAAVEIEPANANPNAFTWTSSPEGLVSYENGKVTVLTDQECEVTITATTWDGALSKSTELNIYRPWVEEVHIQPVNQWNWVEPYQNIQLTALVKATDMFENQLVKWSVQGDNGVSIDRNGVLYTGYDGYNYGVTVTATADNGVSDSVRLRNGR